MKKVIFEQKEFLQPIFKDINPIKDEFRINSTNESERVTQVAHEPVKELSRNISEIWY